VNSIVNRFCNWLIGVGQGASQGSADRFTCGTLRYTPATLAVLFGWLLWGDLTMCLMEWTSGLLVMQLGDLKVSNQATAVLMSTIATLSNVILNPVISYSSDRYRSRWGRRRPFLMFATPFVTLFLILVPWSPEICDGILGVPWLRALLERLPFAPIVLVYGILIGCFQIFNMFIATVYYYLIPDTVPEPVIGRFYAWFRIFSLTAGILFNWFIYGHAHAHLRLLFAAFGLLYAVSFGLMCWKVREGEYPTVVEEHGRWFSPIKNYVRECFGSARNWVIFVVYGAAQWGGAAGVFTLYFYTREIGLTETEFGRLGSVAMAASFLVSVPCGILVDRWGSTKSLYVSGFGNIAIYLLAFFFIHSRMTAFILGFSLSVPGFIGSVAFYKWMVDTYPRAQYGQFASAAAIIGSLGVAIASPIVGWLVDYWHNYYRLCLLVPAIFGCVGMAAFIVLCNWPAEKDGNSSVSSPVEG
jgi:MFS family permease